MEFEVWLTLVSPLLGTVPQEDGTTGFHYENGVPVLPAYVVKGFLKEVIGTLAKVAGTVTFRKKRKAFKKMVARQVEILPDPVPISLSGPVGKLTRPLWVSDSKGGRMLIAVSEVVPVGSVLGFRVRTIGDILEEEVREWFAYGEKYGLGRWRSGGYGRFKAEVKEVEDVGEREN